MSFWETQHRLTLTKTQTEFLYIERSQSHLHSQTELNKRCSFQQFQISHFLSFSPARATYPLFYPFFNLSGCNSSLEIANCQFVGVSSQLACRIDGCDLMPQPVGIMPKTLNSFFFFFVWVSVHCLKGVSSVTVAPWTWLILWSLGYFWSPQVKSSRVWKFKSQVWSCSSWDACKK